MPLLLTALLTATFGPSQTHTALTSLDLSYNTLGSEGGAAVGRGLASNLTLTNLNLSDNELTTPEGQAITEAIAAHPVLSLIDMSTNRIGCIPIGTQLKLAQKGGLELDLSNK